MSTNLEIGSVLITSTFFTYPSPLRGLNCVDKNTIFIVADIVKENINDVNEKITYTLLSIDGHLIWLPHWACISEYMTFADGEQINRSPKKWSGKYGR